MTRKNKKNIFSFIKFPSLDLDSDTKKGIFIIFILALGTLSLLGLFDKAGLIGEYLKFWLTYLFGWGKLLIPIILLGWGYLLYDEGRFEIMAKNYIGMFLFIFSFHALLFLFIRYDLWEQSLNTGAGGGYTGYIFANALINLMGFFASLLTVFCLLLVSIMVTFDTSLSRMFGPESFFAKIMFPFNFLLKKVFKNKAEEEENKDENEDSDEEDEEDQGEDEENDDEQESEEEENVEEEEEEEDDVEEEEDKDENSDEIEETNAKFMTKPVESKPLEDLWWQTPTGIDFEIPLNLLESKGGKPTSGDIEENKEIIRRTLGNFNIPVEMGAVSVGPTVTQYTFKPNEGVKLSKITNLSNDLALALASHPIRIEAPIPGKSLVGVEVPNQIKAVVSLKEVLNSKSYKERKNNLFLALGKDVAGGTWLSDIGKMPHLLVAGATNSGKSVCLNSIIVSLMYQNTPDDLRFIMVDPKRVELTTYNNIPYLLTPVITDVSKTINALKWCLNEMDQRYDVLHKVGTKNIQNYNEKANVKMPYIIFVIDELADLMVTASKDIEGAIIRLAQMARAVGIHLILATQRPSVDVITGLIKANMPARIAFSVASGTDSRTILDTLGAEKLLGRGDMLFQTAEISKPVRLQGAFLSEAEIEKIVKFIIKKGGRGEYKENITERQKVTGIGGVGLDGTNGDEDELLNEAKEAVVNMGRASASLLQRKLRIGYARAASILDQLEEIGVIGPSRGAKPRDILLSKEQFAAMESQGVSGVTLHNRKKTEMPENFLGAEDEPESKTIFMNDDKDEEDEKDEPDEDVADVDEEQEKDDNDNGNVKIKKASPKDEEDDMFFAK
jgi:DNA segregation ATPase FtsK/SpoIIIE, S-DNA-T family